MGTIICCLLPTRSRPCEPIPQADALVVEAINIGQLLFHKGPDGKLKEAILGFARQYGLLGLMTALPITP